MAVNVSSNEELITSMNEEEEDESTQNGRNELHGFADGSSQPLLSSSQVESRVNPNRSSLLNLQSTAPNYTSCSAAIFLIVNSALGAGLLNVPFAFNESGGLYFATIVQCILVIFVIGSLFILAYCSDICHATSFQEIVAAFGGNKLKNLCMTTMIFYCYGSCLTFVIIIGDQFDRIFLSLYGSDFCHTWYLNRKFTMFLACSILILPLSFSKTIDFLKYASSCSVIATLYLIFLAFYEYFNLDTHDIVIKTKPESWPEVFFVTPVICFSYQCQLSFVPTYAGMKNRVRSCSVIFTILTSIIICLICYTLTAVLGIITFGTKQLEVDLMENYDANDGFVLVGIVILIAKIITIYPILLYCGRVAVEDCLANLFGCDPASPYELSRRITIVLSWFFTTVIIAIFIPNISIAIDFLGSLAVLYVFIFPGMCLMSLVMRKDPNLHLRKDKLYVCISCLYIILGTFIFGLTIAQATIKNFFNAELYYRKLQLCS